MNFTIVYRLAFTKPKYQHCYGYLYSDLEATTA